MCFRGFTFDRFSNYNCSFKTIFIVGLLFKGFNVDSVGEDGLKAAVKGEPFREGVHVIKTEVKAVTYHQIEVRRENTGWRAQVILDL